MAPVLRADCRGFQGRTGGCSQEAAAVGQVRGDGGSSGWWQWGWAEGPLSG